MNWRLFLKEISKFFISLLVSVILTGFSLLYLNSSSEINMLTLLTIVEWALFLVAFIFFLSGCYDYTSKGKSFQLWCGFVALLVGFWIGESSFTFSGLASEAKDSWKEIAAYFVVGLIFAAVELVLAFRRGRRALVEHIAKEGANASFHRHLFSTRKFLGENAQVTIHSTAVADFLFQNTIFWPLFLGFNIVGRYLWDFFKAIGNRISGWAKGYLESALTQHTQS